MEYNQTRDVSCRVLLSLPPLSCRLRKLLGLAMDFAACHAVWFHGSEPESDLHFREQQQRANLDVKILRGKGAEGSPSPLWDARWVVTPLSEYHVSSNEPRSRRFENTSRCGRFAGILESLLGIFDKKSHLQQGYCSRLYCNAERKVEFGRRY